MKALHGAVLVLLSACSSSSAQQPAKNPAPTDVVAAVGSTSITLAQVDDRAMRQPAGNFGGVRLSQAIYDARRGAIEEIANEILLDQEAKARGIDRAALEQQDITSKVPSITDDEISSWYEQNKNRVQGATLPQVHDAIRTYLTREHAGEARERYLDQLKAKTNIRVMLEPPRQTIATANRPSKGPANAPVEVIEFSDFQCPFCLRAHPIVAQVLNTYGDRIHFVYRHYPLSIHADARPAAEASQCADEQGKFWPYYEALFGDASHLADADLKQRAAQLGMNTAQFNACVDSHKYKGEVEIDMHAGDEAGVSGTPAFFINGRLLTGAQPFDAFKRVIDEELVLKKR
jgi:protein-disulfide isomerase